LCQQVGRGTSCFFTKFRVIASVWKTELSRIDSALKLGSSHEDNLKFEIDFYQKAILADSVARAIAYAIEQPDSVFKSRERFAPHFFIKTTLSDKLYYLSAGAVKRVSRLFIANGNLQ
jgi:hypothetical protein